MREEDQAYTLIDEDGDEIRAGIRRRFCHCFIPGCVDDELQIWLPGDEEPSRLQIPREMMPYIEGLFDGTMRVKRSCPPS